MDPKGYMDDMVSGHRRRILREKKHETNLPNRRTAHQQKNRTSERVSMESPEKDVVSFKVGPLRSL